MARNATGSGGDLRSTLAELKQAKSELDDADDSLSQRIVLAEKTLAKLKLGVNIFVPLDNPSHWSTRCLAFGKHGRDWRLLIEEGPDGGEPEDWSTKALSDMDRETRAMAFEKLPDLLEAGLQQMRSSVERRRQLIAQADALLSVIASETDEEA